MTMFAMTEDPQSEEQQKNTFNREKLTNLIVVAFAIFGAFLNFVGVCILQSNSNKLSRTIPSGFGSVAVSSSVDHAFDTQWYHTFYYVAVLVAFCVLSMLSSFPDHKMTLMAFLAIGFVYLTDDMQGYISSARAESALVSSTVNFTSGGPATAFTGCFFMVLAWFYMMIFTGGMPSMPSFFKK